MKIFVMSCLAAVLIFASCGAYAAWDQQTFEKNVVRFGDNLIGGKKIDIAGEKRGILEDFLFTDTAQNFDKKSEFLIKMKSDVSSRLYQQALKASDEKDYDRIMARKAEMDDLVAKEKMVEEAYARALVTEASTGKPVEKKIAFEIKEAGFVPKGSLEVRRLIGTEMNLVKKELKRAFGALKSGKAGEFSKYWSEKQDKSSSGGSRISIKFESGKGLYKSKGKYDFLPIYAWENIDEIAKKLKDNKEFEVQIKRVEKNGISLEKIIMEKENDKYRIISWN